MKTLAEVRAEIDALDSELLPRLVRRLGLADDVVAAKRAEGRPIDDPVRERAILDSVAARVPADCADAIRTIYQTLFAESKARQARHSVKGAFRGNAPTGEIAQNREPM